jgi:NADH-quinone oxidoreductase subunit H
MYAFAQELVAEVPFLAGVPVSWVALVLGVIAGGLALGLVAMLGIVLVWLERKVSAHMQDRVGPMRVGGWHGWSQTIADGIKLLLKEDIIPAAADRPLFKLAPILVFAGALAVYVAVPFGPKAIVSDLNIGVFYILAVSSLGVLGLLMAGWASNNKWALLGAMRSAAQVVSYEIPVALALLSVIPIVGSLSMQDIVTAQEGGFHRWFVFRNPFTFLGFFLYVIASLAEVNRTPFDMPEAESELVSGYHTEYSGIRFSIFFIAEYGSMTAVAIVAATLFLGGWQAPWGGAAPLGFAWIMGKAVFLVFIQMWLRWTLPRVRVDQLMYIGWKVITPGAFLCFIGSVAWWFSAPIWLKATATAILMGSAAVVLLLLARSAIAGVVENRREQRMAS